MQVEGNTSPNFFPVGSDLDRIVQGMAPQGAPQEGVEPGMSGISRTPQDTFMWDLGRLDLDNIVPAQVMEIDLSEEGGVCGLEGSVCPEDDKIVDMGVEFACLSAD